MRRRASQLSIHDAFDLPLLLSHLNILQEKMQQKSEEEKEAMPKLLFLLFALFLALDYSIVHEMITTGVEYICSHACLKQL